MTTIDRILCPIDFSDCSRRALGYAVVLARWYHAPVTGLFVHQPPLASVGPLAPLAPVEPTPLSPIDVDLVCRQIAAFIPPRGSSPVVIELIVVHEKGGQNGDPAREILAEAASADLIVMGTHGRSGLERVVLGSVAETVVRKAPCSVLTIPLTAPDAAGAVPAVFRRIVAAVDADGEH